MEIRTQVRSFYALIHQKLNPYKIENLSSSKTEEEKTTVKIMLKCRDR